MPSVTASSGLTATAPASTEQVIPDATEYAGSCARANDGEESKSESDVHENPVDAFDNEQSMDAMIQEDLFSAIDDDDINLCAEASTEGVDSDGEGENVMADNDTEDEGDEEVIVSAGVDDLDDSDDDDQLEPTFETTEDELRELTASGWETFDSDHCGTSGCYRNVYFTR
ncbi:hypothetical protein BBJ28_00020311 [Nothophytophthora sp. Chile5]|nr:hypothetical protein BBJ28_00020311 [Nothophytophthora sp. Chile5]